MNLQSIKERGYAWSLPLLVCFLISFLTRAPLYQNPVIHIDEQFYLLVGDRMLQGYLPYVDVWDRKPIGLFLIYAFIRLFGGSGIVQYQIAATCAAAATAFLIYCIARSIAPRSAALGSSAAYLIYLLVFNGIGGQSPVFYNLLTVIAALWTMNLISAARPNYIGSQSAVIMFILGLAIQIKYTVIFEGIFFGLALLFKHWLLRRSWKELVFVAPVWVFCALTPTICAFAYYAYIGHAAEFLQANFFSIFGRKEVLKETLIRLLETIVLLGPLVAASIISIRRLQRDARANIQVISFLKYWAIAAVAGYLIFGTYYDHYAIPLLLPLCVIASASFARSGGVGWAIRIAVFGMGVIGAMALTISNINREGSKRQFTVLTKLVRQNLGDGCMHVYEGIPILYLTTRACFSTRFVFPSHLSSLKEALAIGVSPVQATEALLAKKPRIVVLRDKPKKGSPNLDTRLVLKAALDRHYRMVGQGRLGKYNMLVYRRTDADRSDLTISR